MMNCSRCFHTLEIHGGDGGSLIRKGACCIPSCPCKGFVDAMHVIDEELV